MARSSFHLLVFIVKDFSYFHCNITSLDPPIKFCLVNSLTQVKEEEVHILFGNSYCHKNSTSCTFYKPSIMLLWQNCVEVSKSDYDLVLTLHNIYGKAYCHKNSMSCTVYKPSIMLIWRNCVEVSKSDYALVLTLHKINGKAYRHKKLHSVQAEYYVNMTKLCWGIYIR